MTIDRRARSVGLLASMALIGSVSCGGGAGAGSTPATTVPTPTPTPTPSPSPTPISRTCANLPPGDPHAEGRTDPPVFAEDLSGAIETLVAERPDIFDDSRHVLSVGLYYVELIKVLDRIGLCGYTRDGEEIAVLNSHEFSENYDILTSGNRIRKFYIGNYVPASVPEPDPAPYPAPAGCHLPPSFSYACGRPDAGGQFYDDVVAAIDQIERERPDLFDFNDVAAGNGPRATDPTAYQNGVATILTAHGFCAFYDGEQITLKKTNDKSEIYDINFQDIYVRTGSGIFRTDCYPANF